MSDKKFTMYVMNDTHYVSKRAWVEGESVSRREQGDSGCLKATPEVLNSFFDKILEDENANALLINGDLINMGDKVSHEDFRNELKRLTDAGIKVFLTWATHDYNGKGKDENSWCHAVKYTETGTEDADAYYKDELKEFYRDFGIAQADSVHETSGSYSVKLCDGLRLVAIIDNGNGRSHCGLFDEGNAWLKNELDKARTNGEAVYCCVHHPVLPPWPVYQRVADFEMYGGYRELREILCEYGVKVIFTGHTHVHGIRKFTSEKNGNSFYDVASCAIYNAFGRMRRAVYDTDTGVCDITSVGIDSIKGLDTNGLSAQEYIYGINFTGIIEKAFPYATKADWDKFIKIMKTSWNVKFFETHRIIAQLAMKKLGIATLAVPAKIAGKYANLDEREKQEAKETYLKEVVFTIMRHIFAGNAPYSPDTVVYKVIMGVVNRVTDTATKLGVNMYKLMMELTPEELVAPFLTNAVRTGDDDNLKVSLR